MDIQESSTKANHFSESVLRNIIQLSASYDPVNLAQGVPDFPCPDLVKAAACDAINNNVNAYDITWGSTAFRNAIAEKYRQWYKLEFDPLKHISVTCGSTEAVAATMLATLNSGDEVIVFEPFYENYGPNAILCDAVPVYVSMRPPTWEFDADDLRQAVTNKTKAIIVNNPHNPTGKVYRREELQVIVDVAEEHGLLIISDEIYEHIIFDGATHIPIATLPGALERTVTISGLSKTFGVTGWRVGTVVGPEGVIASVRKMHDFLTINAPTPFQAAGVTALSLPREYYDEVIQHYTVRRDALSAALDEAGFPHYRTEGSFYTLADISHLGFSSDLDLATHLIQERRVAPVPGSVFYRSDTSPYIRFCFARSLEDIQTAGSRLRGMA